MAQAQVDQDSLRPKPKKGTTFHVILDELHSVTIYKRSNKGISIGLYRPDKTGKRRGLAVSQKLWETLKDSMDMIDLAVHFVNGTVMKENGGV